MEDKSKIKSLEEESSTSSIHIGGKFQINNNPNFIKDRIDIFNKLYEKKIVEDAARERREIKITLPDGSVKIGTSFETTPLDVAKKISNSLAKTLVVARIKYTNKVETVDNNIVKAMGPGDDQLTTEEIFDLTHKLEGDCNMTFLNFDSKEAKEVFWHSSAHILGCALENLYGIKLTHGPPVKNGFFYDFYMGDNTISSEKYKEIEKAMNKIIKRNDKFIKLVVTKEEALDIFKENPFKVSFIKSKIPDGSMTSVYKSGSLIDLCPGPHVVSTGKVKAIKITNNSASNWLGKVKNDRLQRVYGISFPTKKELKEYITHQEEISKRDHRIVGEKQKLYGISKYNPGMPSFLPHGTRIYNRLINLMKHEYRARGFEEVNSPLLNDNHIWRTSGHYFKYRADMYFVRSDEGNFGIKPMNCPGHCAMFTFDQKSYRDLPYRIADFGILHRNEISGALSGLTRVRKFQQDDAHIFCTKEQVFDEIKSCLDFVSYIYKILGFEFSLELATRPKERVGRDEDWDKAEDSLRKALKEFGMPYTEGDGGAFYGPKIDILVKDCFNRNHQLGTIQLDFNLPDRFNLQYKSKHVEDTEDHLTDEQLMKKIKKIKEKDLENKFERKSKLDVKFKENFEENAMKYEVSGKLKHGFRRPIMIHRAILGSLERCIAILIETTGGKWPFWLSPRQVIVLPLSEKFEEYAQKIKHRIQYEGYFAAIDLSAANIKKKVRHAQMEQYNYILVVGKTELDNGTISVRDRDQSKPVGVMSIDKLLDLFKSLDPEESDAWKKIKEQAFFKETKLDGYEKDLKNKVYLEGDGMEYGDKDKAVYEEIKDSKFSPDKYPGVSRWLKFVQKHHFSNQS